MSEETTNTEETVEDKKAVMLDRFELPNRLVKNEDTETDTFAQFVAEPFERGFGHTIGNSLRRVLLSSLEGAAITSVRIAGCQHEFSSLPGVVEDVTDIILNLKKVKFKHYDKEPRVLTLKVEKEGVVTAGDIQDDNIYEVVNKDQVICTLDRKTKFDCEFEVKVGRGFNTGDENKRPDMPIGVIAIDSIFSPVTRVKYAVGQTRVGQMTDFDKLELDIWTDGRTSPADALLQASAILRHHLDVFVNYDDDAVEFESAPAEQSEENAALKKLLNMSVNEIELSVRAANCLNNANITTVGQLAMKTEAEMLKYRNFGKKSLNEIKDKLTELGLSLGMSLDPSLLTGPVPTVKAPRLGIEEEAPVGLADLIAQNLNDE
ncbi:DNA-directed RNA polymerase subunit alpha [Rubritalea squalenifaciens DSM 18772]|uniref:DNA-directed RNA polymerase subunit alpha n=1 Tax=Rubritalea squalenifaciens DSM 18772 TaxID=1123071 RepID=A0A1M6IXF6_9BACT|nr:DNA-directed RNA polymerase subunit alpha [Rubritalea squalenifaciens]SHJ39089.1 DNA-directed RNA polymerase subunit alpha [Rubritalea squalenifaciens DSM 18772]